MKLFEKYFIGESIDLNWEYIESIPEFMLLKTCEQNPRWHSEGNAWIHTQHCVKEAYLLLAKWQESDIIKERTLLMAVLFHDIGKGVTTKFVKGNWHAYGHEIEGEKITRRILWNEDFEARETVCSLVRYHMDVLRIAEGKDCYQKMMQMSFEHNIIWKDLLFVKTCDCFGSIPENLEEQQYIDKNKLNFLTLTSVEMGIYNKSMDNFFRAKAFNRPVDFNYHRTHNTVVNVVIGLPGSGKNTFIENNFNDGTIILSRDDIRTELGYCAENEKIIGTQEQEDKVTEIFNKRLKDVVAAGKNVVINNINLKKKYRDDYKKIVNNPNVCWNYYYIEAPTLEDNFKRREMIPQIAFLNMIDKFEWPRCEEYDQFSIIKQK